MSVMTPLSPFSGNRTFTSSIQTIAQKEVFKMQKSTGTTILIFKNTEIVNKYNIGELSFWVA